MIIGTCAESFCRGPQEHLRNLFSLKARIFLRSGAVLLGLFLLLTGCASRWEEPPTLSLPSGGESWIQPDDTLEITFAEEPSLTQQVKVTREGFIHLSYLAATGKEDVRATNRTPKEVAADINRLAKENGILKYPLSHVRVVEYAERAFSLFGEVGSPGRYVFAPVYATHMNLPEAVAMGGGFTEFANRSIILVKRDTHLYRVNLKEMVTRPGVAQFQVLPGDVITVERSLF